MPEHPDVAGRPEVSAARMPEPPGAASSHERLRAAVEADRSRIAAGDRPTYHVLWAPANDGSIDVTVRELPLIHQYVPDEAGILDGARFLIARILDVDAAGFDVRADR